MFDWFSIFSVVTGLALVAGYALLGCTWLIWRTEGSLQEWAFNLSKPLFLVVVGFVGVVSIWTPLLNDTIAQRWFSWPNILYLSPVPILTAGLALMFWRAINNRREVQPFALTMGLFLLSFLGSGGQPVAQRDPAGYQHLGRGLTAGNTGIPAGRHGRS